MNLPSLQEAYPAGTSIPNRLQYCRRKQAVYMAIIANTLPGDIVHIEAEQRRAVIDNHITELWRHHNKGTGGE